MNWLDSALEWFGRGGAAVPVREAAGQTIDPDEEQWRRLSGDTDRDLMPMTQDRMQRVAAWLWESNLVANRLVELPLAYLLAEGVRLTHEDAALQAVLDKFWRDPINTMDVSLPEYVRELALFGEQCWPIFVNEHDGHVRLGYLDPQLIADVIDDPDNRGKPIGVVTRRDSKGRYLRLKVVIAGPEECFSKRTQAIRESFADGECIYFRVNGMRSGRRGRSDLLAPADWLDAYDEFLFGELDRAKAMRAFFWDVKVQGLSPEEVEQRARKISAPKFGSVRVHNESEEWKAESPALSAGDTSEIARLLRNHLLGGATVPEHWYGGGGDVNRAVGAEMADPTMKIFSMRQRQVKHALELTGRIVLWRHLAAKSEGVDWDDARIACECVFPEMQVRDTTKYAAAMQQTVAGVVVAIDKGLMTRATGVALIAAVAGRLGVEYDAEAELQQAEKDAARRQQEQAAADSFTGPVEPGDDGSDGAAPAAGAAEPE